MMTSNNATKLHKEILIRVVEAFKDKNRKDSLDRIPLNMRPKNDDFSRCCVYKDRAIIKYRCMAALGFGYDDETDEMKTIGDYLEDALNREKPAKYDLKVINEACSACQETSYMVTNACMGCLAKPCQNACKRGAISFVNGKSVIDTSKCVNCGLCMQACPYHAIIYIPTPCEDVCPVGAIKKSPITGKQTIDQDKCIYCGKCIRQCPFAAIAAKSQMIDVMKKIQDGYKVTALVAPSISGQFPGTYEQTCEAIRMLGFNEVFEVAAGADKTTEHETAEFIEKMEGGAPLMTTSCCPAYIQAVKKIVPELEQFVSTTPSPMGFAGKMVKAADPETITVFIGPCMAKRAEAAENEDIDYVLTFEELGAMFIGHHIDVLEVQPEKSLKPAHNTSYGYAVAGGVTKAIEEAAPDMNIIPMPINGLSKKNIALLKAASKGKCKGNFIEVMACEGGCLSGPGTNVNSKMSIKSLQEKQASASK